MTMMMMHVRVWIQGEQLLLCRFLQIDAIEIAAMSAQRIR
jgi:hypothetical protein